MERGNNRVARVGPGSHSVPPLLVLAARAERTPPNAAALAASV